MTVRDKTVVLTGGASGIGKATAQLFARNGAHVLIGDLNEEQGQAVSEEARKSGLKIDYLKLDLGDFDSVERFAAEIHRKARPDILVNAAGWDRIMPFMENPPDFMDKVIAVNLMGPIRLTKAILPAMIEANAGKIVNVSSDAGRVGSMGETVYAAAKGGIIAFTKSLAREMARHKITVNAVCPGPTDTPLLQAQPERMREALTRAIPFKRVARPDELADAILFFASPSSDYVTGQVLSVSGGLTMVG
jgi:2-hydroxycyclohexanecarboxyl-CoA dehydrogenase